MLPRSNQDLDDMGQLIDQRDVRRAWERFVERGDIVEGLRTDIAASWRRCSEFQVATTSDAAPLVSETESYKNKDRQ